MTQYGPEFFRKFADIITEAEKVNEISIDLVKRYDDKSTEQSFDRANVSKHGFDKVQARAKGGIMADKRLNKHNHPDIEISDRAYNLKETEQVDPLFHDWMNSEHAPFDSDSGDDNAVIQKAKRFLHGKVHPEKVEKLAAQLAKKF
jgi:hypothetical protein